MASGILYESVSVVKASLTALGLTPVTDPRNARPMSVFIELPTVSAFNYNIGDITLRLRILAAPPGNSDAGDYLMTIADQILASSIAITDMAPGNVQIGGQDLPTYDLTVRIAVKRN